MKHSSNQKPNPGHETNKANQHQPLVRAAGKPDSRQSASPSAASPSAASASAASPSAASPSAASPSAAPLPRHVRHYLPLLLPLLPAALSFAYLGGDAPAFLLWWLTLTVFGLAALPLAGRLFRPSPDHGFLFAKPLSLIITAVAVFILSSLRLAPFRTPVILGVLIILFCAAHLPKANRAFWRSALADRQIVVFWGIEETLLGAASLYWTFARGLHPALDSLEKFMDYGFMMSLWRTDYLPAADMWLAGKSINYYYFGQYLATFWGKACGIAPVQAYNLAMGSMFALTLCLGFAVALLIGSIFRMGSRRISRWLPATYAGTAAILLALGGNGHVFYYGGNPFGTWLHDIFSSFGWPVGQLTTPYWFADATRYIGYNPDTADKTIHEFPYYSFLVADLHAHVVSLLPVLLTLGLLMVLITRPIGPSSALKSFHNRACDPATSLQPPPKPQVNRPLSAGERLKASGRTVLAGLPEPHLLVLTVLLAVFMMGNYWDFVIYLGVTAVVLALRPQIEAPTVRNRHAVFLALAGLALLAVPFLGISDAFLALAAYAAVAFVARIGERLWTHPLTIAVARLSELFFGAHLIALPFNAGFEPIAKSIALAKNHTPLIQLWILYGFLFLAGLFFVIDLIRQHRAAEIRAVSTFQPAWPASAVQPGGSAQVYGTTDRTGRGTWGGPHHMPGNRPAGRISRLMNAIMALNPADRLLLVFLICGFGLILLPELVYVVDIYSGDFKRANTMFKFTYQAFILLSFVLAWAPLRFLFQPATTATGPAWKHTDEAVAIANRRRQTLGFILLLLFIPSLMYPVQVTTQWLGSFSRGNYQGLDGVRLFAEKDSSSLPEANMGELAPDYAAIRWFNENVKGQPVVLESFGDSYTDYCRISAYTGLPTVIGWQTHEWLWRTSKASPDAYGSVVVPRQNDVRSMYTGTDRDLVTNLMNQYNVRYIVIGDLERQQFATTAADGTKATSVNETLLRSLGRVAFSSGTLVVIERT